MNALVIEKEVIANLQFPQEDVLKSEDEFKQRIFDLQKSVILGTLNQNKVRIIFEDTECVKQVQTTIWGLTSKLVVLKKGLHIPIHRIHKILT